LNNLIATAVAHNICAIHTIQKASTHLKHELIN